MKTSEIRAAHKKSTLGPWWRNGDDVETTGLLVSEGFDPIARTVCVDDAEFIAVAHEEVPKLLDALGTLARNCSDENVRFVCSLCGIEVDESTTPS